MGKSEKSDNKFFKGLIDFLNKYYKKKYDKSFEKELFFKEDKEGWWLISTESSTYPYIRGNNESGDIEVWLATTDKISDIISFACILDRIDYTSEEILKIWETIFDRKNWSKVKEKYYSLIEFLMHADSVAIRVTEKYGIKTTFFIPHPKESDRYYFFTKFNSRGMSDEEKLKMIEKATDAVVYAMEKWYWEILFSLGDELTNLKEKLAENLKQIFGYPFKWNGGGFFMKFDEIERDKVYMNKVRYAMTLDDPLQELRKLWEYDDLVKPIEYITLSIDRKRSVWGRYGMLSVESDDALHRRFKGIMSIIGDEYPIYGGLKDALEGKDKYPITSKFVKAGVELVERIKKETGIEIFLDFGEGIRTFAHPSNYSTHLMQFVSKSMLPLIPSKIFSELNKHVEIIKKVWTEWIKVRKRLCEEMGIDETIFAIRDVIEAEFNLPPWSFDVIPDKQGPVIIADISYLSAWKKDLSKESSEKVPNWEDFHFEIKFLENKELIRVYSSPIFIDQPIANLISREIRDQENKKEKVEVLKKLVSKPKELEINLVTYLTNRNNLKDVESVSPSLAMVLENLINYLEDEKRKQKGELINMILDPNIGAYLIGDISALDFAVFTIRLDFRNPGSPEIIKRIPSWLHLCLLIYRGVKNIMYGSMLKDYK